MAAGSSIAVTPGSGAKLATSATYTESAATVQDPKMIFGEQYIASYITGKDQAPSTANASAHLLEIMAGASLKVRIRRIEIYQATLATTAAYMGIFVYRLSSAGTGGTAQTPSPLDPSDAASGATAMTLPTVKGTETTNIVYGNMFMLQTAGASSAQVQPPLVFDFDRPRSKPVIIAAGIANGIAIKNLAAIAGATVQINVWFDETAF